MYNLIEFVICCDSCEKGMLTPSVSLKTSKRGDKLPFRHSNKTPIPYIGSKDTLMPSASSNQKLMNFYSNY